MKFASTEDLDDIDALNMKNNNEASTKDDGTNEETKSYTNTVNSKEFREYLNKHGLVLFPVKTTVDTTEAKEPVNLKKKTMIKRFSSMFTRNKMPYSSENEKIVVAAKKIDHNRYFSANSSGSSDMRNNSRLNIKNNPISGLDDDWKSSISSVLSAADTEDYLSSPMCITRKTIATEPRASFQRNQLYKTMPHAYYRPINAPIAPMNGLKSLGKQENYDRNNPRWRHSIVANNRQYIQSPIDPFTFAKIHQIKKHTDDNFRRDSSQFEPQYCKIAQQHCNQKNNMQSNIGLRKHEYQNNLNNYATPRSSLISPVKEVSREEVMNKIYDYYRKSVNNTPVQTHSKDNCYSTLPMRLTKVYQANGLARISNPIQKQQKIYDEVHQSSGIPVRHQDYVRISSKNTVSNGSFGNKNLPVTSTPVNTPVNVDLRPAKNKKLDEASPRKINSSHKKGFYSSQVFKPIAELCSKIFTDSASPKKYKIRAETRSSYNNNGRF